MITSLDVQQQAPDVVIGFGGLRATHRNNTQRLAAFTALKGHLADCETLSMSDLKSLVDWVGERVEPIKLEGTSSSFDSAAFSERDARLMSLVATVGCAYPWFYGDSREKQLAVFEELAKEVRERIEQVVNAS